MYSLLHRVRGGSMRVYLMLLFFIMQFTLFITSSALAQHPKKIEGEYFLPKGG